MYFSIQNYAPQNPSPYDDTGWTFQYMRDLKILPVTDKAILDQPMTMLTADAKAPGGIEGTGSVLVVEHTADNNLVTFRFKNKDVKMLAAEDDFELGGHKFRAGAIIVPNADRAKLEPMLKDLGLSAWAVASAPSVKTHDLDVPRIGYVHSWTRTQDEGWWRAALDTFGVPYTYFADQKLREGNLRSKYDVHHLPARRRQRRVAGQRDADDRQRAAAVQEDRRDAEPRRSSTQSDDIRGGMGVEGLVELAKFVQEGGTLITEGSTATIFPEYGITTGVTVEEPAQLFVRGSILRGKIADMKSPIAYGYGSAELPVYFNQSPVLNAGGGGFGGFGGGGRGGAPGDEPERRHRPERDAERGAAADSAVRGGRRRGAGGTRRAAGRGRHGAVASDGRSSSASPSTRRGRASSCSSSANPERHAAVGHAGQRPVPRQPRGGARPSARQGPRGDVRHPAVLALADAGHLHARASTRS